MKSKAPKRFWRLFYALAASERAEARNASKRFKSDILMHTIRLLSRVESYMRRYGSRCWVLGGMLTVVRVMTSACGVYSWPKAVSSPSPSPTASFGHVTLFPLAPGVPAPNRLFAGPDGAPWFTAFDWATGQAAIAGASVDDAIVLMTPAGVFTVFPLPWPGSAPDGIATGPDGNVWLAEFYANAIGRVTPQGAFVEFPVPARPNRRTGALPQSQPHAIVQGPDGNLWFLDLGGNKVARLTTAGTLTEFPIPPHPENPVGGSPYSIAAGPDGALWFTEQTSNRIGRITVDGRITEFTLPGVDHVPSDVVASADGALWFLEPNQNLFGRITVDGRITEFSWPCASTLHCRHPDHLI
jgi:virginiamycin B lyase